MSDEKFKLALKARASPMLRGVTPEETSETI